MEMRNPNLTAIIIAKNNETEIKDCLESVSWAGEIIVIDTGSTDKTLDIARKFTSKVFIFTRGSYSDWRNEGLKHSHGEWILYVDTDERVTHSLKQEVTKLLNGYAVINTAYAIPRRNIILGREMKHGGWLPDYVKRLFKRKNLKRWTGDLHEEPIFVGEIGYLKNSLVHIKHNNLSDMVTKTNIWSEVEAKLMYDAHHPPMNVIRFMTAIFREFWLRMIKQKAFLDGTECVIYACYQVYSRFISYAKLWEMQVNKSRREYSNTHELRE